MKNVDDILRLAPSQHGLLFDSLRAESSEIYFEQFAYTLSGALDEDAFRRAWMRVLERHSALRAAFFWSGIDEAVQVVRSRVEPEFATLDFSSLPEDKAEARYQALLRDDRARGFSMEQAPLMRWTLVRRSGGRLNFVWSFHHVVMDGWSFSRVLTEVSTLYAAFSAGAPDPLPEAPPFRNVVAWQSRQDANVAEAHYAEVFEGFDGSTPLADAFLREGNSRDGPSIGECVVALGEDETARFAAAAKAVGVTQAVLLQAAWAILLARHTGDDDVCFGYGTSGRPADLPGAEAIVGMMMATLPMRVRLSREMPLRTLCRTIAEALAANEDTSFLSLARINRAAGVAPGRPLFDTAIAFENYPVDEGLALGFCGLSIEALDFFERTTFPLVIFTAPGKSLRLRLQHDRSCFDDNDVAAISDRLTTVLKGISQKPDGTVADATALSVRERAAIANALQVSPVAAAAPDVVAQIVDRAAAEPTRPAIEDGAHTVTYAELVGHAAALAHALLARGVGQGDFVAIYLPPSAEAVIGAVGVMMAGAAFVPIDPASAPVRNQMMMADAKALVLTSAAFADDAALGGQEVMVLDPSEPAHASPPETMHAGAIAYMIYTSGSTGRPKGVPITRAALSGLCADWVALAGLRPSDRGSLLVSPAFDASIIENWPTLTAGACLVVPPLGIAQDPPALKSFLIDRAIDVAMIPTPFLVPLLDMSWPQSGAPRIVATGGVAVPKRPAPSIPFAVINVYGPTECTVAATAGALTPADRDSTPPDIGRPLPGVATHVVDVLGDLAPPGVAGELMLSGPRVMPGYHAAPELTAKAMRHLPSVSAEPLYATGDQVRILPDGRFAFLGRGDHQVKIRGTRVELGEVEAAITATGLVKAVAVTADTHGDTSLTAFVELPATLPTKAGDLTEDWRALYDGLYRDAVQSTDPNWDLAGWRSAITGAPVPAENMRLWAEGTVARLRSLEPKAVLEIGCGTGLIAGDLAPHTPRYHATDISEYAIAAARRRIDADPQLSHVTLATGSADEVTPETGDAYDLIVLSSVVQYFECAQHLRDVLARAVALTQDGGTVFIGDVKSLPLLPLFAAEAVLAQLPDDAAVADLGRAVAVRVAEEEELALHPAFFCELVRALPRVGAVSVRPRPFCGDNELSRYRYDVFVRVGEPPAARPIAWEPKDTADTGALCTLSDGRGVEKIENRRLSRVRQLAAWIAAPPDGVETVNGLREALSAVTPSGLEPDECASEGAVSWLAGNEDGAFDFVKSQSADDAFAFPAPATPRVMATSPTTVRARRKALERLRHDLGERLPQAFIPARFVPVTVLPRTPAGKVDRRALSMPTLQGGTLYQPPRTPTEESLCAIFEDVLGQRAGLADNFFALGGHSLSMMQVVSRIRTRLGLEIPLDVLFERSTVAMLAPYIDALAVTRDWETADAEPREEGVL